MMQQDIKGPGELFAVKEQVINEKLSILQIYCCYFLFMTNGW